MSQQSALDTENAWVAQVVIAGASREYDRIFDYGIPEAMRGRIFGGSRVMLPFGHNRHDVEGYVVGLKSTSNFASLKDIRELVEEKPAFNTHALQIAYWMKGKCLCTLADAIKCQIPPGSAIRSDLWYALAAGSDTGAASNSLNSLNSLNSVNSVEKPGTPDAPAVQKMTKGMLKNAATLIECIGSEGGFVASETIKTKTGVKNTAALLEILKHAGILQCEERAGAAVREKTQRVAYLVMEPEEVLEMIQDGKIRSIHQIRALENLIENENIPVSDFTHFMGISPQVLNTLKKKGMIDFRAVEVLREPVQVEAIAATKPFQPGREQEEAINGITRMMDTGTFGEALIRGVTGSGKTEVYLQIIAKALEQGRQCIVLVPEISLTPQTVERFVGRFGRDVAVLHSRLSPGERYDQWRLIRDGRVNVVVGARSAVFAPMARLGIIIIDEEHENTYKSDTTPRYHARDVARERCRIAGGVLVLGSATPSIESYYRAVSGEIALFHMTTRANNAQLPEVCIVDMRAELEAGNKSVFSRQLQSEMEHNIKNGLQTILFLNRRGHSTFVMCRSCGLTMTCRNCNLALTYHTNGTRLVCHFCGYTEKNPQTCPNRKSTYIRHFGVGTQRIEEEVQKTFPGSTVIRMDVDTTGFKNSHELLLRKFRQENIHVLIGTQMIAKGHDFPGVTLVGVLAADGLTGIEDFRASERAFQLISQVAGRAGRGQVAGKVVVQAYNTDHYAITCAARHDFLLFYEMEIELRRKMRYPPFCDVVSILFSGEDEKATAFYASETAKYLEGKLTDPIFSATCPELMGPAKCRNYKLWNKYRQRIVIKTDSAEVITPLLMSVYSNFSREASKKGVNISIDVNPAGML